MKKCTFYSLMFKGGKVSAVLQSGWTDGVYNYYRAANNCDLWHAIHPLVGLSVASGYTQEDASEKAHSAELKKAIAERMQQNGPAMIATFEKAIQEAKNN